CLLGSAGVGNPGRGHRARRHRLTPTSLLSACAGRGIVLFVDGGRLRFRAPAGAMTPELRAAVVAHKAALLAHLAAHPPWDTAEAVRLQIGADDEVERLGVPG